jgi:hypothetical protein
LRTLRIAAMSIALCAWLVWPAFAEEEVVYTGQDDIFESLRATHGGSVSPGKEVEEAIGQFFEGGEEDPGTFPASEIWDHDFSFRTSPPPTWGYNGRTYFRYSEDDISGVDKWEKELELNLNYGDWRSYFRVSDYNAFAYQNDPMRLEKARLRYGQDNWKVTVGSLGGLFGRGLMVSMYEERNLDFDNEVEGAKLEYKLGKADITALWGTRKERDLPHHSEIAAARVQVPIGENIEVGVHAGQVKFPYELGATAENPMLLDYDMYGANAQWKQGPFTAYGETVRVQRPVVEYGDPVWDTTGNDGRGHYLNLGFNKSQFALTAEFKDYKGIAQPFSVLPPVRKWQEQASADPLDDKGYLYEAQWSPFNDSSFFEFSYGQGNSHLRQNPHTEFGAIYHSPATNRTSYIFEYWKINHQYTHHTIAKTEINHRLDNEWTTTGTYEHERIYDEFTDPYLDYAYIGEIAYKSLGNIIYTREETTNQFSDEDKWELWEFKIKPDEQQEIGLMLGSRREGYVCSGGICRLEPAFDGIKIDYLVRF